MIYFAAPFLRPARVSPTRSYADKNVADFPVFFFVVSASDSTRFRPKSAVISFNRFGRHIVPSPIYKHHCYAEVLSKSYTVTVCLRVCAANKSERLRTSSVQSV